MLAKLRGLGLPGLLRGMWMIRSGVDLQFPIHRISHLGFRQHAANRFLDETDRLALAHHRRPFLAQAAFVAAMPTIDLLIFLAPGQLDVRRVDDHHVIAGVDERGVSRLVLALQQLGREGRHAPQDLVLGVDDMPPAVRALRARHKRTHEKGILRGWVPTGGHPDLCRVRPTTANPNSTDGWGDCQVTDSHGSGLVSICYRRYLLRHVCDNPRMAKKRARDTNQLAWQIVEEATGNAPEPKDTRNPFAVGLSKLGASKGG